MIREIIYKDDGREICFYERQAEKPRAVACLVHGSGEYGGRFARHMEHMAQKGLSCYAADLPGHGKSSGERGLFVKRQDIFTIIRGMTDMARERTAQAHGAEPPLFVIGHSMGGTLVLSYRCHVAAGLIQAGGEICGYAATSPMLMMDEANYDPRWIESTMKYARSNPLKIVSNGIDKHDSSGGRPGGGDPFLHTNVALGTVLERFEDIETIMENTARPGPPVYIAVGLNDRVCKPQQSERFAGSMGGLCAFRSWEGLSHNLWRGEESFPVVEEMADWILSESNKRLARRKVH